MNINMNLEDLIKSMKEKIDNPSEHYKLNFAIYRHLVELKMRRSWMSREDAENNFDPDSTACVDCRDIEKCKLAFDPICREECGMGK